MTRQPARYRRIIPEFVDSILRAREYVESIIYENSICTLLEDYVLEYATSFVHSEEGEKAENQFRYVFTVVMLRVADILMTYHAKKLETICHEIEQVINNTLREFEDTYVRLYGRRPTVTERDMYKSLLLFNVTKRDINDIASMYGISVSTVRTYLSRVRTVFNIVAIEEIDNNPYMYTHLYDIQQYCRQCGINNIIMLPIGYLGVRYWHNVYACRLTTLWHVLACRCMVSERGYYCDSWTTCICFEYFYLPFMYALLNSCERRNWQLLDVCTSDEYLTVEHMCYRSVPICEYQFGLWYTFTDIHDYVTHVLPRSRTYRNARRLVEYWYNIARSVLRERYETEMSHRCLSE